MTTGTTAVASTVEHPIRRRSRRGRRAAAVLVALAIAGAAAAVWSGVGARRPDGPAAGALPPNTAQVTRRTLKDSRTADGELGYGTASTATSRLAGTLTYLPAGGAQLTRGQPVYKVNNSPVTLMYGAIPAYRALASGAEGPDVRQLEANLRALGYTGFTVDEEYTTSTATAVRHWQEDQGLDETGAVELGRVVFAPDAVRVTGLQAAQGDPVAPGQRVLTYTGTAKAVTVDLDTADQRLAQPDAAVVITLPDNTSTGGHITDVTTVIEPGSGPNAEPQTKVEVVVGLDDQRAAAAYALASVDVTFTAAERAGVLTVPVAALLALHEGGFGVEVVDGATSRYVPVRTGLFSGGWVEISGDGISEGTTVGMPK